jgi:hypothetical protein
MSYRLSFTGVASPEITHLLHAVEHRLNGRASVSLAGEDPVPSGTEITIKICPDGSKPPCADSGPHEPWIIVHGAGLLIGVAAIAFAAGIGLAMIVMVSKLKAR